MNDFQLNTQHSTLSNQQSTINNQHTATQKPTTVNQRNSTDYSTTSRRKYCTQSEMKMIVNTMQIPYYHQFLLLGLLLILSRIENSSAWLTKGPGPLPPTAAAAATTTTTTSSTAATRGSVWSTSRFRRYHPSFTIPSSRLLLFQFKPQQQAQQSHQSQHLQRQTVTYLALRLSELELNNSEGSSKEDDDNEQNQDEEEQSTEAKHLIAAGTHFKAIDENVGNSMIRVGEAWNSITTGNKEWSDVAEALEEVSTAFWDVLSKKGNIPPTLASICRSVAQELEDISTIEGCSSIGPATSIPNWIAIHGYLEAAAEAYKGPYHDDEEELDTAKYQKIHESLVQTSQEIEQFIECF